MLAGLQGAGKTTLAGKLAKWLAKDGHTPLLVAADLQRPNAVTQLQVVGEQAGVAVYAPEPGNGVGDPVKVAKDGVKEAERKQYDTVIVDTAGRLGIDAELMKQAVRHPQGRRPRRGAVRHRRDDRSGRRHDRASAFQEGVDFTGVVLTKLDGDARGGAALSVASVTGRPIMFASTGEGLDDFEPFHPDRMASRILDLGDILTLIEQAQEAFDEDEARKIAEKFATDTFTLDDFLEADAAAQEHGLDQEDARHAARRARHEASSSRTSTSARSTRTEAIIQSMTLQERSNCRSCSTARAGCASPRARARRSPRSTSSCSRFEQAAKMMKTVAKGGVPQVPGMGPIPGAVVRRQEEAAAPKKGSQSGNPAKRAAENAALVGGCRRPSARAARASGSARAGGRTTGRPEEELAALQKMLGR